MSAIRAVLLASSGKRSKWVVALIWLLIAIATIPFTGKLNSVSTDDQTAFLPHSAESKRMVDAQQTLSSKTTFDITVVYRHDNGLLTTSEQAKVNADHDALLAKYPQAVNIQPSAFSNDGRSALVGLSVPESVIASKSDTLAHAQVSELKAIREIVEANANGLQIKVTGPGAFDADAKELNASINGPLLAGTVLVVAIVLILTYRSPVLWLLPLIVVGIGDGLASWIIYLLTEHKVITLDGQSANIVPVLVFGVGTDYALLLLARYREELRSNENTHAAMSKALRKAGPTILATGAIVVCAMLCLLLSQLNSNRALAAVGALSIGFTAIATVTLLPALMLIFGRRAFWPFVPKAGVPAPPSKLWASVSGAVSNRPAALLLATTASLIVLAGIGLPQLDTGLKQIDAFRTPPGSVEGAKLVSYSFTRSTTEPLMLVTNTRQADQVRQVLGADTDVTFAAVIDRSNPGPNADCVADVDHLGKCIDQNGKTEYIVKLRPDPDTAAEHAAIKKLRAAIHTVPGADALLGAGGAKRLDLADSTRHDQAIVVPAILLVSLVIFCLLLRSIVAPLVLIATVVVSYAAALGAAVLASRYLFGFPAEDPGLLLLSFVFLVTLGIDYNVFLAARIREYVGTGLDMKTSVREGLNATGGVITSAGVVLAATFAVLATMPVVFVTQLGFAVAFGVLLDTLVVRSILVPATFTLLGDRTWWPKSPSHRN